MARRPLPDGAVAARLEALPGWTRAGGAIRREYRFRDFAAAVGFVNRVAEEAEARDHHPDILIHGYNRVTLTVTTHDAGGLTDHDFALAAAADRLAEAAGARQGSRAERAPEART